MAQRKAKSTLSELSHLALPDFSSWRTLDQSDTAFSALDGAGRPVRVEVLPPWLTRSHVESTRQELSPLLESEPRLARIDTVIDLREGTAVVTPEFQNGSLANWIAPGPICWQESVWVAASIGRILDRAHESDAVHGALSPDVVLLDAAMRPVVGGLELAWASRWALAELVRSTPGLNVAPPGPEEDTFSVGMILHSLLCGSATAGLPGTKAAADVYDLLPPELVDVVARATESSPDRRYRSMDAVQRDLTQPTLSRLPLLDMPNTVEPNTQSTPIRIQMPPEPITPDEDPLAVLFAPENEPDMSAERFDPGSVRGRGWQILALASMFALVVMGVRDVGRSGAEVATGSTGNDVVQLEMQPTQESEEATATSGATPAETGVQLSTDEVDLDDIGLDDLDDFGDADFDDFDFDNFDFDDLGPGDLDPGDLDPGDLGSGDLDSGDFDPADIGADFFDDDELDALLEGVGVSDSELSGFGVTDAELEAAFDAAGLFDDDLVTEEDVDDDPSVDENPTPAEGDAAGVTTDAEGPAASPPASAPLQPSTTTPPRTTVPPSSTTTSPSTTSPTATAGPTSTDSTGTSAPPSTIGSSTAAATPTTSFTAVAPASLEIGAVEAVAGFESVDLSFATSQCSYVRFSVPNGGNLSPGNGSCHTEHSYRLGGVPYNGTQLRPDTTYAITVTATTSDGATATRIVSVHTDPQPQQVLTISNLAVTEITASTARVSFTANKCVGSSFVVTGGGSGRYDWGYPVSDHCLTDQWATVGYFQTSRLAAGQVNTVTVTATTSEGESVVKAIRFEVPAS